MYKTGGVAFDINANRTNGRTTSIQFMTQDTGSAKLSFSFTKDGTPLPLSAVDAKIVLLYADGSFYKKSLTITDKVNGNAEYVLSDEELKHYGIVKAEIKLYYANGQALATSFFTFSIAKTLEDQNIIPTAEYYIDDFETLRDGINRTVQEISQTVEELRKKFADLEAIETKEGAQDKVNAHANNTDIHVTKSDKDKWNGGQLKKLTDDQGKYLVSIQDGLDFHKIVDELDQSFFFYTNNTGVNVPSLSTRGLYIGLKSYGEALAMDYAGGTWRKTLKASGWTDWVQIETSEGAQKKVDAHANNTDIHITKPFKETMEKLSQQFTADFKKKLDELLSQFTAHNSNQDRHTSKDERAKWNGAVTFANIMLKNGATAGTRTPIYAKWGPFLILRGHVRTDAEIIFGSIPAAYVPSGGGVYTVPLSGTGGTANLIIYDNGDLKIKYPDPADSSKMGGGYYLDVIAGFQEGGTV